MVTPMRPFAATCAIFFSVLPFTTGCNDVVAGVGGPPVVKSVLVTPDTATIYVGQTLRMTVTVQEITGRPYSVAWSSSALALASVDSTGLVTGRAMTPRVVICAEASNVAFSSVVNCATLTVQVAPTTSP